MASCEGEVLVRFPEVVVLEDAAFRCHIWSPKLFACQKPSIMNEMFSKFNHFKLLLMKDISFDGMAEMPKHQWNRQFSLFCLNQTDADGDPKEFEYPDGTRVPIYPSDVHDIIGLPCEGKHISVIDDEVPEEMIEEVSRALGVKQLTISTVSNVVESVIDEHSSKKEQEAFKIGVVILSFAYLLDCRDRDPKIPLYLLPYLSTVKEGKRGSYSTCIVGGCCIVPQIFYLDSIDFGVHKARPDVFPRIKACDKGKLDMLINIDKKAHNVDLSQWYGNYKQDMAILQFLWLKLKPREMLKLQVRNLKSACAVIWINGWQLDL
ncbi:hypothetical protein BRADI_4g06141v3 [Brachypodium distachyon]|uniref:Uncharacterized protein n=1 Tax=Brachypodium distachyon TaxID=15368 RepID=A0A0Q3EFT1_BRADI|nr:hypothetical protein BRADI_4g06141v3 [Brachypodium distachyon]